MLLSEDKLSHLAHVILGAVKKSPLVTVKADEPTVLRAIKRVLATQVAEEEQMDRIVRGRLASYARPPAEGTPEWDVLYRRFFDEETRKHTRT